MSPTTGSSGRGWSTSLSFQWSESLMLLSSSPDGLGGWSLQRDTRFLLCMGLISLSQSFDREREHLRSCSLSVSRPRSPCKGLPGLKSENELVVINRLYNFNYIINYKLFSCFNSPNSGGCATKVWHQHLQLLHRCCSNLLIFFVCVWWNLTDGIKMTKAPCGLKWNVFFIPLIISKYCSGSVIQLK